MNERIVTVFGGTGFLGRRVVRHLRKHGFSVRIASRHPSWDHRLFGLDDPQLQSVAANIHDEGSVADALAGAYGAVNAVSLYLEHGSENFHSVHVVSAERVAAQARRAGVTWLAHVSGIGSDAASTSLYIRKRGEGELAVRAAVLSVHTRNATLPVPDRNWGGFIAFVFNRRIICSPERVNNANTTCSSRDCYFADHIVSCPVPKQPDDNCWSLGDCNEL
jgi:uncharacterized protein YbjT (DUF2867 family)